MKQKVTKSAAAHRFFLFYAACVCAFAAGVIPARALDYTAVTDALGSLFGSAADANEGLTTFRSLNIPSGGKAEALGTAFTGLADDVGFFDYNPAASCLLVQTQAAVMHNAWIADSALETCAGTIRFNNLGLGAAVKCFYVPFTQYNLFGDRISGGYYSETTAILNVSYNFFSGYYFKGLAVGANIKASYRSVPDFADSKTNELLQGSGLGQSAFAVMADVGGVALHFHEVLERLGKTHLVLHDQYPHGRPSFGCMGMGVTPRSRRRPRRAACPRWQWWPDRWWCRHPDGHSIRWHPDFHRRWSG